MRSTALIRFAHTPDGDETGRYAKYVVRHGSAIAVEPLSGYEGPSPLDYYGLPKRNRFESVVQPYGYFTDGHWLLLTTFSEPIIVDGQFLGAVGSDIALNEVQKLVTQSHPLGTGRVSLISDKGAWLSKFERTRMEGGRRDRPVAGEGRQAGGDRRAVDPARAECGGGRRRNFAGVRSAHGGAERDDMDGGGDLAAVYPFGQAHELVAIIVGAGSFSCC